MTGSGLVIDEYRGWEIVRLRTPDISVDVVPGKGGDVLAVRSLRHDVNVLWSTPWGLPRRGALAGPGDSMARFMDSYPGGWQTIFPNGGAAVDHGGVELEFHGEACRVPWDWQEVSVASGAAIELHATLVRSPFRLHRRLHVDGAAFAVTETATNESMSEQEAMWSHHPAFGAPFLSGVCTIDTSATRFVADDEYVTANSDLAPGAESAWPMATSRDGAPIDLRRVPDETACVDRLGFVLDFGPDAWAAVTNPELGLRAVLRWDGRMFGSAWFWFEGHGTDGFPWYQRAHVLAIEPAASHPGQGLVAAREKTARPSASLQVSPRPSRSNSSCPPSRRDRGKATGRVDGEGAVRLW